VGAIVAQLAFRGAPETDTLRRMLAVATHRGPSHELMIHGACALGVSYAEAWRNASLAAEGGLAVAFEGTIDNIDDLSRALTGSAAARTPEAPAKLLITAFQAYGQNAPARLRGVFAAVVTDGRSLWCFRDHLGYSPLYYRLDVASILVASEAKQIVAGAGIQLEPDIDLLESLYYSIDIPEETRCPLRGVSRLPQRKVLVASPESARTTTYWDPESVLESGRYSATDVKERFEQLMTQSVTRMMTPETLISLSGGIDSSAVAAFAAPAYLKSTGRPLPALSVVYPKVPTVDERRYVELLAAQFGMTLHTYEPQARPLDGIEDWIRRCDSPLMAAPLAQSTEFFAHARELGARTILTGDVAEFVFDTGYRHLLPHLLYRGRFAAVRRHLAAQRGRGASRVALARQLVKAFVPDGIVDARERAKNRPLMPDWLDTHRLERVATPLPPRWRRWREWQVGVLSYPNLTAESEAIGQAISGVRVRCPWSDVDLWEFFLSMPAETKFPDIDPPKLLVRRLLRGRVPDEILLRRKQYANDAVLPLIDYGLLQRLVEPVDYRMPGVDYGRLAEHLRDKDLRATEIAYAYGLAAIHTFVQGIANGRAVNRAEVDLGSLPPRANRQPRRQRPDASTPTAGDALAP
jgi:asparagine synthetase B (glutamine-hydrolysing)